MDKYLLPEEDGLFARKSGAWAEKEPTAIVQKFIERRRRVSQSPRCEFT